MLMDDIYKYMNYGLCVSGYVIFYMTDINQMSQPPNTVTYISHLLGQDALPESAYQHYRNQYSNITRISISTLPESETFPIWLIIGPKSVLYLDNLTSWCTRHCSVRLANGARFPKPTVYPLKTTAAAGTGLRQYPSQSIYNLCPYGDVTWHN